MSKTHEGIKRTGRVGLWLLLPPLGFWRSREHGRQRQADLIAEAVGAKPKKLSLLERLEASTEEMKATAARRRK